MALIEVNIKSSIGIRTRVTKFPIKVSERANPLDRLYITNVVLAYYCYAIDKNVHWNFSLMNELCKQIWGFHGSCPQFRLILVYRHYLNRFVDGIHFMR